MTELTVRCFGWKRLLNEHIVNRHERLDPRNRTLLYDKYKYKQTRNMLKFECHEALHMVHLNEQRKTYFQRLVAQYDVGLPAMASNPPWLCIGLQQYFYTSSQKDRVGSRSPTQQAFCCRWINETSWKVSLNNSPTKLPGEGRPSIGHTRPCVETWARRKVWELSGVSRLLIVCCLALCSRVT